VLCSRVPTLGEVLDLVNKANADGKDVGVFVQVWPHDIKVSLKIAYIFAGQPQGQK
jgi:hypothetical protein